MSTPTAANEPMSKAYDPKSSEPKAWDRWIRAGAFDADPQRVLNGDARPYSILIPPPNVTAALHLGHALNNTIQDILTRAHRMMGYETLWMPGTDHAGIATQTMVDKKLKAEGKGGIAEYKKKELEGGNGREAFIALVQEFKDEYEARITHQLQTMGCSCDWRRQRFTMDDICARAVREAFFRLFRDGLIYRGKRLVNWDPVTQTALADDEVEMEEVEGAFYYLRYPMVKTVDGDQTIPVTWSELGARGYPGADEHPEDEQAWVTVATTRPETYLGDTAVAMNPKDPRAASVRGFNVMLPLVGRIIPIIEDDYVVLPVTFGGDAGDAKAEMSTGFLKVTPAHDPNDYMIGQRHDLPQINVMAPDATISDQHGWEDVGDAHVFVGKSREDARKLVVKEFQARSVSEGSEGSLLEAIKPHVHSVGHSYRSHVPVEPYLSDQWYCKVSDDKLRGSAQRALKPEQRTEASLRAWPKSTPKTGGLSSNEPRPSGSGPLTNYLITYTTYGSWLHGDERGSADRDHNLPGTPYIPESPEREASEESELKHPKVTLDETERSVVIDAIKEVCLHRGWSLHACHVRTNHVHVVVSADQSPERVMNDFKSYATRHLKDDERTERAATVRERTWTRHGSTRYLNTEDSFNAAKHYVLHEQGNDIGSSFEGPLPHGRGSLKTTTDGSMTFYPARYAKTYETWHDNLRDWCISRQLWWGHRIPVWHIQPKGDYKEDDLQSTLDALAESQGCKGELCVKLIADHEMASLRAFGVCTHSEKAEELMRKLQLAIPNSEDNPLNRPDLFGSTGNSLESVLNAKGMILSMQQDPDVLDTWFSSALWPLSTMGWPDTSAANSGNEPVDDFDALLKAYNPTSVLTTAREIITLWVSRMTMFNRYFLAQDKVHDKPPFKDVFIHAMIQDGEGRKMSKSLGNGVDPLDIIETHGADAMRFTLCQMTTQTQDVRMPVEPDPETGKNTSPKFDIGRNLCNKLWNASRFAMSMLEKNPVRPGPPIDPQQLSLVDRWMLSRVAHAQGAIGSALRSYQFKDYADALYDLLWRDFCDWYLESIKPTLSEDENQPAVLRSVLDSILRLMHPVTPFITESVFERLDSIPSREILGVAVMETKSTETLCQSGWPSLDPSLRDEVAEEAYDRCRALVSAIREVRASNQVPPKRSIVLHAPGALGSDVKRWNPLVETLANVREVTDSAPEGASVAFVFEGSEYKLSDLADAVDSGAQRERLEKELADLDKSISALEGRLNNPGYTQKAPAHLVDQTRAELTQKQADRDSVRASLDSLG
jgi:valyl-tRNA synthetase